MAVEHRIGRCIAYNNSLHLLKLVSAGKLRFYFAHGLKGGQWLATLGTWGTLWLEFALPVLLLVPRGRRAGLALGTALHLGIWATMRIGLFSPLMLISYLAFVERDERGRWRVSLD